LSGITSAAGTIIATGSGTDLKIEILRYEPAPVEPGALADIWIKVSSQGTTISSLTRLNGVKLELVEEFPFYAASDAERVKSFGTMEPGETRIVRYKVKIDGDASPGTNEIKFKYTSTNEVDGIETSPLDIEVKSSSATIAVVSVVSEPEEIPAGQAAIITIELRNDALGSLRDITAKIDLTATTTPFAPTKSTTEKKIRSIAPGQIEMIKYDILALPDAEAKVYKIPFTLSYFDEAGNQFTKEDTIGLLVSAEPDLNVNLEDADPLQSGQTGKVIVSVSNIGPTDVKFMTLKIVDGDGYTVIGKSQEYLGNLESDDFETAEFSVNVDFSSKGEVPLKVILDYRDTYNLKKTDEIFLPLPVYTRSELRAYGLDGSLKSYYAPFIYLFLILFVYFVIRDWRRTKAFDLALKNGLEDTFLAIFRTIFLFRWKNIRKVPSKLRQFFRKL